MLGNGFQRQYIWDTLWHRASWFRHSDAHILCSLGGCQDSASPEYGGKPNLRVSGRGSLSRLLWEGPLGSWASRRAQPDHCRNS